MYSSVENYRKVFHIFARVFTIGHFRTVSKSGAAGPFNSKFACPSILLQILKNYIYAVEWLPVALCCSNNTLHDDQWTGS